MFNNSKNATEISCELINIPHHDMGVPARLTIVTPPSDPLPVKYKIFRYPYDGQGRASKLCGPKLLVKAPGYESRIETVYTVFQKRSSKQKILKTVFLNSESFHTLTEDSESKSALFPSPVKMFVVVDGFIEIWPTAIRS